jgi:hypothetical protein
MSTTPKSPPGNARQRWTAEPQSREVASVELETTEWAPDHSSIAARVTSEGDEPPGSTTVADRDRRSRR